MARISWPTTIFWSRPFANRCDAFCRQCTTIVDVQLAWICQTPTRVCVLLSSHTAGPGHFEGSSIRISRMEEARSLGRIFNIKAHEECAMTDCVAKAWRAFCAHQAEICRRKVRQAMRLRFFDAVLKPTTIKGMPAMDPTTVCATHGHTRSAGFYQGEQRAWAQYHGWRGERVSGHGRRGPPQAPRSILCLLPGPLSLGGSTRPPTAENGRSWMSLDDAVAFFQLWQLVVRDRIRGNMSNQTRRQCNGRGCCLGETCLPQDTDADLPTVGPLPTLPPSLVDSPF